MDTSPNKTFFFMRILTVLAIVIFFSNFSIAQQQPTLQDKLRSDVDINTQFQLLLNQSRNQDASFKIIRRSNVEIIQKNVNDSLSIYKEEIAELKNLTSTSRGTITNLQDSVVALQTALQEEVQKSSTIGFLGMDLQKGMYHAIVWIIIILLALSLIITLISFRKAKVDTIEHKETAEEAQNELHAYKKKAMEKEQQLKRQLLDEQLKRNS